MEGKDATEEQKEVFSTASIIKAIHDAVCVDEFSFDVDFQGAIVGTDRRSYQFFSIRQNYHPTGTDIRTIYCSDPRWSPKKAKPATQVKCGSATCNKSVSKWCGKCKKEGYCSIECQKASWNSHKTKCRHAYDEIGFWRWFSTGKCSLIHYTMAETIRELLDYNKKAGKGNLKKLKNARLIVTIEHGGKTYSVKDASLSGPYRHVNATDRARIGYQEAVFVFDQNVKAFNKETVSLKSFPKKDIDRMGHVIEGTEQMLAEKCRDVDGRECSKQRCVLPFHLSVHQLCVLRVERIYGETENEKDGNDPISLLYVDVAGMQYGQDQHLILSKNELPNYYVRTQDANQTTAYSMEDYGVEFGDYHVPEDMKGTIGHAVSLSIGTLSKVSKS